MDIRDLGILLGQGRIVQGQHIVLIDDGLGNLHSFGGLGLGLGFFRGLGLDRHLQEGVRRYLSVNAFQNKAHVQAKAAAGSVEIIGIIEEALIVGQTENRTRSQQVCHNRCGGNHASLLPAGLFVLGI